MESGTVVVLKFPWMLRLMLLIILNFGFDVIVVLISLFLLWQLPLSGLQTSCFPLCVCDYPMLQVYSSFQIDDLRVLGVAMGDPVDLHEGASLI